MNRYQFIGNIGQNAEVRPVNGTNAISFSVAVTEKYTDRNGQKQETTTWVRCTLWRAPDKSRIADFLTKGQKVLVEGKPTATAYVTKEQTAGASLDVRVDSVELLGGAQQQQPQAQTVAQPAVAKPNQVRQPAPVTRQQAQPQYGAPPIHTGQQGGDDDLPF